MEQSAEIVKRLVLLFIGSLISAIGVNGFLKPIGLLSGGVTGISLILNHLSGINIGVLIYAMNIPLFAIAYFHLKKEFLKYSLINMTFYSVLVGLTEGMGSLIPGQDVMVAALFGGVLNGLGMGLIFRGRGSQGGMDIVAMLVRQKWDFSIGRLLMLFNLGIVAWGSTIFGIQSFFYTLISMYIGYNFVDKVQVLFETKKSLIIISKYPKIIGNVLIKDMNRAVTYLKGEGGYTHKEKYIIYTIINPRELPRIKEIIAKYDKDAFLSVEEKVEVQGYRFEQRFL